MVRIEIIRVDTLAKEIRHFRASGFKEIKLESDGGWDEMIVEGLGYINNYMTQNGYRLVNVLQDVEYDYFDYFIEKE